VHLGSAASAQAVRVHAALPPRATPKPDAPTPARAGEAAPPQTQPGAPNPALAGLRESRAFATLAATLVDQLAGADPATRERLRTRLREVVEIGSARDTSGPLAVLYAAARRDPAAPLAPLVTDRPLPEGSAFEAALAAAAEALRGLDERFAARAVALAAASQPAGSFLPALPGTPTPDLRTLDILA